MKKICFLAQFPPPVHGLSMAVNTLYCSPLSDKYAFEKADLTDNRRILKTLLHILRSDADLFYLTISQSRGGNLRDLLLIELIQLRKKKCLIHLHGGFYRQLVDHLMPAWQKKANYRAVNRLAGAIALGPSLKHHFTGMIADERIFTVFNCVDDSCLMPDNLFEAKASHTESKPVKDALYLSNFLPGKGYREVLQLARIEKQRHESGEPRRYHFHFAGHFFEAEEERYFHDFIAEHSLSDYVTFHGVVQGERKNALLNRCDVFLLLTRYSNEGQPISILEAMGNGMRIITTDHAGIPDIVQDGRNGVLITKDQSVEEIYESMLASEPQHSECIRRNRVDVQARFSEAAYLDGMEQVFEEVLENK